MLSGSFAQLNELVIMVPNFLMSPAGYGGKAPTHLRAGVGHALPPMGQPPSAAARTYKCSSEYRRQQHVEQRRRQLSERQKLQGVIAALPGPVTVLHVHSGTSKQCQSSLLEL